jgi:hypothetical protein
MPRGSSPGNPRNPPADNGFGLCDGISTLVGVLPFAGMVQSIGELASFGFNLK